MKKYAIGLDIGGTKIAFSVMEEGFQGSIFSTIPTNASEGYEAILASIIDEVKSIMSKYGNNNCIGIGIGTPGPFDYRSGCVQSPPNLPGWDNVPLLHDVQKNVSVPVFLDNDANLAALGEYVFGAGKGSSSMIYITVSTGIGAGIILNGELFHGASGNAGELGHIVIDPNGPMCKCGSKGCLEAMASGTAIQHAAFTKLGERLSAKQVAEKALEGSVPHQAILKDAFYYLSIGVRNVIQLFNPDRIVIGGGVAQSGDVMMNQVEEHLQEQVAPFLRKDVTIQLAELGTQAGTLGAAYLPYYKKTGYVKDPC